MTPWIIFRGIRVGWESLWDLEVTRLGAWISVFWEETAPGASALPQRKGCLKCSRFLLLPQKVTFIQRKKKKKEKKMTRCPSLGSLPSPFQLLLSPQD